MRFTRALRRRAPKNCALKHCSLKHCFVKHGALSQFALRCCALVCCVSIAACSEEVDLPPAANAVADTPAAAAEQRDQAPAIAGEECAVLSTAGAPAEVWLDHASVIIGSDSGYPEEAPATSVDVAGFWIDVHEVTNAQFAEFVRQTGYITTAEKHPDPAQYPDIPAELLKPGSAVFVRPRANNFRHWTEWWRFAEGASWRAPLGPGSSIAGLEHHPVVHVSYLDAKAYATWRGRTLPTEAQWERAASVGSAGAGGAAGGGSAARNANTWQGFFPLQNTAVDGFQGTAPVGCFRPNEAGVHDMIGNVWEWVSDEYVPHHQLMQRDGTVDSSAVPRRSSGTVSRVVKGGSFLCASSYCQRDRAQGRQPQEEDFGAIHIGFRTVRTTGDDTGS